jgi:DNA-binding beta-propeller fold protein YncE
VATDAAGDVFVADNASNSVVKVPAGGGAQVTVASGLSAPRGVAVDSKGDVFIAEYDAGTVVEEPWTGSGYGTQTTVASGLNHPEGVVVDPTNGWLAIAESGANTVLLIDLSNGNTVSDSMFSDPKGVAVDSNGNVFVADNGNNRVMKILWDGSGWKFLLNPVVSGLNDPWGVSSLGTPAPTRSLNCPGQERPSARRLRWVGDSIFPTA